MDNVLENTTDTHNFGQRRRRGGRPRLLPEERRGTQINTCWTNSEYERLAERAQAVGKSEVDFIRHICLNQSINSVPAINRQAVAELSRLGNNLNQIARRLNTGEEAPLIAELDNLKRLLNSINRQLLDPAELAADGN